MEPERKIEKVLRAFAKRRRDDAGAPFDLHPATRRLLQGEVTRRKPKTGEDSFLRKFFRFRIRFTLIEVLVVLSIVAILPAMLLPSLSRAKNKSRRVAEMSAQRQAELQRQLETPAPTKQPAEGTAGEEQKKEQGARSRFESADGALTLGGGFVGGGSQMATSSGFGPTNLYTFTNSGQVAMAPPPASAPAANGSLSLDTSRLGVVTASDSSLAANEPGSVAQGFAFGGGGGGGGNLKLRDEKTISESVGGATSQKFIRVSEKLDTAKLVSNGEPVLVSFDVFQSGSELRIVDSDGSVYNGYFEAGRSPVNETLLAGKDQPEAAAKAGERADLEANRSGIGAYFFRVSGTNLSLKQNVLFTGNLSRATNGFAETLTNFVDRLRFQTPVTGSVAAPLPNLRISGTVLIENQPQLKIEAVPVSKPPN